MIDLVKPTHFPSHIRCVSTTRLGGVSQPSKKGDFEGLNLGWHSGDELAKVRQNWRLLEQALGLSQICLVQQVHGVEIFDLDCMNSDTPNEDWYHRPVADAIISSAVHQPIAILTADCMPVVLCTERVIAVVHAGWRGLLKGIIPRTIEALRTKDSDGQLYAWVGPSIHQSAFEVGAEVREAFVQTSHGQYDPYFKVLPNGQYLGDLQGIAQSQLAPVAQVSVSTACTFEDEKRFYSWRRQSPTGRMATIIVRDA